MSALQLRLSRFFELLKGSWLFRHWIVQVVISSLVKFFRDNALTLAAALAFYTVLSLSPLMIMLLWLSQQLGFEDQKLLINQIVALIGSEAGNAIEIVINSAKERPTLGTLAGLAGFAVLALSAGGVFLQLQASLNIVWGVAEQRKVKSSWIHLVQKRLLSVGMILSLGFVAVVSLLASTAVAFLLTYFPQKSAFLGYLAEGMNLLVSLGMFTLIFGGMFRYLPDTQFHSRHVWFGGFVTAVLFTVGKSLIGMYLGSSSIGSAFGAAGSLVILLVWVYYSAVILLLGAEITQAWAAYRDSSRT